MGPMLTSPSNDREREVVRIVDQIFIQRGTSTTGAWILLRGWRCVQDEDYPPLVYRHEPSEDEARPSLMWMLREHYSCNIE
jgi:hypothetical protein